MCVCVCVWVGGCVGVCVCVCGVWCVCVCLCVWGVVCVVCVCVPYAFTGCTWQYSVEHKPSIALRLYTLRYRWSKMAGVVIVHCNAELLCVTQHIACLCE